MLLQALFGLASDVFGLGLWGRRRTAAFQVRAMAAQLLWRRLFLFLGGLCLSVVVERGIGFKARQFDQHFYTRGAMGELIGELIGSDPRKPVNKKGGLSKVTRY